PLLLPKPTATPTAPGRSDSSPLYRGRAEHWKKTFPTNGQEEFDPVARRRTFPPESVSFHHATRTRDQGEPPMSVFREVHADGWRVRLDLGGQILRLEVSESV